MFIGFQEMVGTYARTRVEAISIGTGMLVCNFLLILGQSAGRTEMSTNRMHTYQF